MLDAEPPLLGLLGTVTGMIEVFDLMAPGVSEATIPTMAGVDAPLLGLLGTVTSMINTSQVITLVGTGYPQIMASGISVAPVTTVLGLVVAASQVGNEYDRTICAYISSLSC